MCSGSEAGSYFRRTDFEYHSNLGLRVIKKKKKNRNVVAGDGCRGARACRRVEPLSKIGLCLVIHKLIYVRVQVMVAEGPGRYNMLEACDVVFVLATRQSYPAPLQRFGTI